MLPPPPRSTLFPYTTLFRSQDLFALANLRLRAAEDEGDGGKLSGAKGRAGRHHSPGLLDRKSTRLNSSHVSISYAVFCLKKKTRYGLSLIKTLDLVEQRSTT